MLTKTGIVTFVPGTDGQSFIAPSESCLPGIPEPIGGAPTRPPSPPNSGGGQDGPPCTKPLYIPVVDENGNPVVIVIQVPC